MKVGLQIQPTFNISININIHQNLMGHWEQVSVQNVTLTTYNMYFGTHFNWCKVIRHIDNPWKNANHYYGLKLVVASLDELFSRKEKWTLMTALIFCDHRFSSSGNWQGCSHVIFRWNSLLIFAMAFMNLVMCLFKAYFLCHLSWSGRRERILCSQQANIMLLSFQMQPQDKNPNFCGYFSSHHCFGEQLGKIFRHGSLWFPMQSQL